MRPRLAQVVAAEDCRAEPGRSAAGVDRTRGRVPLDGVDRAPAVPDLVDDQNALAAEERIGRELEEGRLRAGPALVVVVLHGGNEDVPKPEAVGEHSGGNEPAAGDREEHVELRTDP